MNENQHALELGELALRKFQLEERLGHSLENNLLEPALCLVQKNMGNAEKSTKGYNYKYAKLIDLVEASRPALIENGFNVRHRFMKIDDQWVIRMILAHKSGQWISSDYPIHEIKDDKKSLEQSIGTWITYFKRYQYMSLLNINIDDESDNDGERSQPQPLANQYISEAQLKLLESKMRIHPDIAQAIPKKYNIESREKILKSQFNNILNEFPKS